MGLREDSLDNHGFLRAVVRREVERRGLGAGLVDARAIGQAVRSGRYPTQPLKQLWHLTAQWGRPRDMGTRVGTATRS